MGTHPQNTLVAEDVELRRQVEELKRQVADLVYRVMILEKNADVSLELDTSQHTYAEGNEFKPDIFGPPVGRRKGTLR